MLTLALANWASSLLVALFVLTSVTLILFVLIQRPQGGGLSGAFGSGAGSGQTAFGTKTGDVLTISTVAIFVLWVGIAIGLNFVARPPEAGPAAGAASGVNGAESAPAESEQTGEGSGSGADGPDQDGDGDGRGTGQDAADTQDQTDTGDTTGTGRGEGAGGDDAPASDEDETPEQPDQDQPGGGNPPNPGG